MICEMCGNDVESLSPVRVEGSVLQLCSSCSKFGVAVTVPGRPVSVRGPTVPMATVDSRMHFRARRMVERDLFGDLPELELAPDWSRRVRQAREKLNWSPEELGKRLNEKKSVVLKVEAGTFRPPDASIRKIERLLKIRLTAEPSSSEP